jgi:pimeloyl-ACP methyl ester carboxylesterase
MKKNNRQWTVWMFTLVLVLGLAGCDRGMEQPIESVEHSVSSADGIRIQYEVAGKGEPALVFVHCWTCDRSFWDQQYDYFARNYQVVRLDLAGHGASAGGRARYTMASFGADVAAVVNDLKLQKVVLVGHSMGGPVSVEAAKLLGDRVVGVVGVDTFYTPFEYPTEEAAIAEFVKPFEQDYAAASAGMVRSMFAPGADPALVENTVNKFGHAADKTMAVQAMYDIFHWSRDEGEASLAALGERLRNINGDPQGGSTPLHDSVILVPGTGHFVQLEKPDVFNEALSLALEELMTASAASK